MRPDMRFESLAHAMRPDVAFALFQPRLYAFRLCLVPSGLSSSPLAKGGMRGISEVQEDEMATARPCRSSP
jgi:hypothetical protein